MKQLYSKFYLTLFLISITFITQAQTKGSRPNIIVILCDDLGYSDVGFNRSANFPKEYGIIPTPEMDALASNGVILSQAHVAHPFCGPSRAALMTGRYPHNIGAQYNLPNSTETPFGVTTSETFFSKVLQENNYNTGMVGKWHLGHADGFKPNQRGFDYFFGFLGGGHNYFESSYENNFYNKLGTANPITNEYQVPLNRNNNYVDRNEFTDDDYLTDLLSDEAANFITTNASKSDPYFLYVAYNAPHTPLDVPASELAKFKTDNPTFEADIQNSPDIVNAVLKNGETREERTASLVASRLNYAAMVSKVDQGIGKIKQAITNSGEANNTLIIFLSDNGGKLREAGATNYPLVQGKGSVDEGGHRVPMFVHWPAKISGGQTYDKLVSAIDLYPTLTNLAGATLPSTKKLDGVDIMDKLIAGEDARGDWPLFVLRPQLGFNNVSIKLGNWKIIKKASAEWKLYDMSNDIGETTDVRASTPNGEQIVADLIAKGVAWAKEFKEVKPGWFDTDENQHTPLWEDGRLPVYNETFGSNELLLEIDLGEVSVRGIINGVESIKNGAFKVALPEGVLASEDIVVTYSIGGTATPSTDYTALSGSVTILNGTNSTTIPVEVVNDGISEPNETITITLLTTSIGAVNSTIGEITISDPTVPTVLSAGDIAFVGYNSSGANAEHDFAFMLLKNINASTTITFCDRGWKAPGGWLTAGGGGAYAVDDTVTWTADADYSAGTIIRINLSKAFINETEIGTDAVSQSLGSDYMTFNSAGDVLYAYQGAEPVDETDVQKFIAVLGMNGALCVGGGNTAGCKPSNLTLGVNGLEIDPEMNNAVYKGIILGTPEELRPLINNPANWVSSDDTVYTLRAHSAGGAIGIAGGTVVLDDDNDGVENSLDLCPNTPSGKQVNATGCAESQLDDDNDGIKNDKDNCPNTPDGEVVDANGCELVILDDDNDGIPNDIDVCPNTPSGKQVNTTGCAESQLDDDNDGVKNDVDTCPNTPSGKQVNATGCAESQLDDDSDGVKNDVDTCPNTPTGKQVNASGCAESQLDDDSDGVKNDVDVCPNTPSGETVNATGCIVFSSNNFNIQTIGETCPSKENGSITITAQIAMNYEATVNGVKHNFTTSLNLENLKAGTYSICINIPTIAAAHCFETTIEAGTTISAKASITSNKVAITVFEGTAPFNVFVNKELLLKTNANQFLLTIKQGDRIEVTSDIYCEGNFNTTIDRFETAKAYPNPSNGLFNIAIQEDITTVEVEVYTTFGQLLSKHNYPVIDGKIVLDLASKPIGMYVAKILLQNPVNVKLVKK